MGSPEARHPRHRLARKLARATTRCSRKIPFENHLRWGATVYQSFASRPNQRQMSHGTGCYLSRCCRSFDGRVNHCGSNSPTRFENSNVLSCSVDVLQAHRNSSYYQCCSGFCIDLLEKFAEPLGKWCGITFLQFSPSFTADQLSSQVSHMNWYESRTVNGVL